MRLHMLRDHFPHRPDWHFLEQYAVENSRRNVARLALKDLSGLGLSDKCIGSMRHKAVIRSSACANASMSLLQIDARRHGGEWPDPLPCGAQPQLQGPVAHSRECDIHTMHLTMLQMESVMAMHCAARCCCRCMQALQSACMLVAALQNIHGCWLSAAIFTGAGLAGQHRGQKLPQGPVCA